MRIREGVLDLQLLRLVLIRTAITGGCRAVPVHKVLHGRPRRTLRLGSPDSLDRLRNGCRTLSRDVVLRSAADGPRPYEALGQSPLLEFSCTTVECVYLYSGPFHLYARQTHNGRLLLREIVHRGVMRMVL